MHLWSRFQFKANPSLLFYNIFTGEVFHLSVTVFDIATLSTLNRSSWLSIKTYADIFVLGAICVLSIHSQVFTEIRRPCMCACTCLHVCNHLCFRRREQVHFSRAFIQYCALYFNGAPLPDSFKCHPQERNKWIIFTRGNWILSEHELFSRVISLRASLLVRN